jgi:hypothetical protein
MMSVVMLTVTYADCHINAPYAECRYAECRGASRCRRFKTSLRRRRQNKLERFFLEIITRLALNF